MIANIYKGNKEVDLLQSPTEQEYNHGEEKAMDYKRKGDELVSNAYGLYKKR